MSATNGKPLDHLRAWAVRLQQKRGHNKATIALANKLARIAWAVWVRDAAFREVPTTWRLKSDPSDASLARSLHLPATALRTERR